MANCPKCGASAEQPLKTWTIKRTPIALYECPSCKTKWRSKLIVEAVAASPVSPPETRTAERIEVEPPTPVITTVAAAPTAPPKMSGLRRLFLALFS